MDKITMLGTGHAMTMECFNTCFVYESEQGKMLVDTGGGQQVLVRLRRAGIKAQELDCVYVTHLHTDHLLGLPWIVRACGKNAEGKPPLEIIAHGELCKTVRSLLLLVFPELEEEWDSRIRLTAVEHGEELVRCGRKFRFYDAYSDRCSQYGFVMELENGGKLVFNGDVPRDERNHALMEGAKYLMHEAFCLEEEGRGRLRGHSSVAQTAQYAADLKAENLILIHGGDQDILHRKEKYTEEAKRHYTGPVFVPDDMEVLDL